MPGTIPRKRMEYFSMADEEVKKSASATGLVDIKEPRTTDCGFKGILPVHLMMMMSGGGCSVSNKRSEEQ